MPEYDSVIRGKVGTEEKSAVLTICFCCIYKSVKNLSFAYAKHLILHRNNSIWTKIFRRALCGMVEKSYIGIVLGK